jgi:hypothetical protein
VEGKSFGMESGALEIEGSEYIPLAPCLCCYSLGAIDHRMTEMFVWVGGGASPHHVNEVGTCLLLKFVSLILVYGSKEP